MPDGFNAESRAGQKLAVALVCSTFSIEIYVSFTALLQTMEIDFVALGLVYAPDKSIDNRIKLSSRSKMLKFQNCGLAKGPFLTRRTAACGRTACVEAAS
jgi:hypothetical protein